MAPAKSHRPRRSLLEKRRIVELALRSSASNVAIAREHGVHPNSLVQWRALYDAGKLTTGSSPAVSEPEVLPGCFLPVMIAPAPCDAREAADDRSIVQITLSSGSALRIESCALEHGFVCALIAELKR